MAEMVWDYNSQTYVPKGTTSSSTVNGSFGYDTSGQTLATSPTYSTQPTVAPGSPVLATPTTAAQNAVAGTQVGSAESSGAFNNTGNFVQPGSVAQQQYSAGTSGLGNNLDYDTWADAYGDTATPTKYGEYLSGEGTSTPGMTGFQMGQLGLGAANAVMAYKQYGLAKDTFAHNKKMGLANYEANRVQANNAINNSNTVNQNITAKANALATKAGGAGNQTYTNQQTVSGL